MLGQTLRTLAFVAIFHLLYTESRAFSLGGTNTALQQRSDDAMEEEMMDVFPVCWGHLPSPEIAALSADCPNPMAITVSFMRSIGESGIGTTSRTGPAGLCQATVEHNTNVILTDHTLVNFRHMIAHYHRQILFECIRGSAAGGEVTVSLPHIPYFKLDMGLVTQKPETRFRAGGSTAGSGVGSSEDPQPDPFWMSPSTEDSSNLPAANLEMGLELMEMGLELMEVSDMSSAREASLPSSNARRGRCLGCLGRCFGCVASSTLDD